MDILSHILWPLVVAKYFNTKFKLNINLKKIGFWGAFPDILSFGTLFIWSFFMGGFPHPADHGALQSPKLFALTEALYSLSHSLVIFIAVFILLMIIFKKPIWVLGGWLLHILMDIPTHPLDSYPTDFLWPFLNVKFNGIQWREPVFLITNYVVLACLFGYLYRKEVINILQKFKGSFNK